MKIYDTDEILKFVKDSGNLVLKIGMGKNEKAIWCPSFKAQNSRNPQEISDSIWETFAFVDCHLRNLNSVSDVVREYYTPHIYIGTTKSIESSNITPDFIEKIAKIMTDAWEEFWNRGNYEKMEYDIQYRYGSDCYFGHLVPTPKDMEKIVNSSSVSNVSKTLKILENDLFGDGDLGMQE